MLGFSQTAKQYVSAGDKSLEEGDYLGASIYYKKSVDADPTLASNTFKYAESLRMINNYEEAEVFYAKTRELDVNQQFPMSLFWLATMKKNQKKYMEAADLFRAFKSVKSVPTIYTRKAKNEVLACEYAHKFIHDSLRVIIKNLGENLNSGDAEFAPYPLGPSNMLLSVLKSQEINQEQEVLDKHYHVKLYKAKQTEEEWSIQEELSKNINNPAYHNANATISDNGKRLYFSRCDDLGACAIYVANKENGSWQNPVLLEAPINIVGTNNTQPSLAYISGKEILFFVSNRQGGKGEMDIWHSVVTDDGKSFSAPKNAGKKVNSPDQEVTPFYNNQDGCLYFSSNWHNGFGGFDIFKSCGELKSLGIPQNVGVPINSPANDLYFSYSDSSHGFLASNRLGSYSTSSKTCCNDIYSFEFLPEPKEASAISEIVAMEQINQQLPVLYFHNDEPNPKSTDTTTHLRYLETYQNYSDMTEKYQEEYARDLSPEDQEKAREEIEDFFVQYVDRGVSDLQVFLKLLKKELEQGLSMSVTIKGYASPLAKTDYNVNLTLRRISSLINDIKNYENGVFIPYIDGTAKNKAHLEFEKIPFGEYKSDTTVSDNINDTRNSIYSKKAALERKIEVLSVSEIKNVTYLDKKLKKDVLYEVSDTLVDFDTLYIGKKYEKIIQIINYDTAALSISDITLNCEMPIIEWDKSPIQPGEERNIKFIYKPSKVGKIKKDVIIKSDVKSIAKIRIKGLVRVK